MLIIIRLINILYQLIVLLVFVKIILSYFMDPWNPVRRTVDQIVEPMLAPIRRVIPAVGMFDFSPFVLLILIWIFKSILTGLLLSLA